MDWPPAELHKHLPELRGLKVTQDQSELALILRRTGENIQRTFESIPNTTCREDVLEERLRIDGTAEESQSQRFLYLLLPRPDSDGMGMDEHRTNSQGKPLPPEGLQGGSVLTTGFAAMPMHFHPRVQSQSIFRGLGRQAVEGRQTFVVGLAQRPETARLIGRVDVQGRSAIILLQGVAWIDPVSYQILHMRTDLLAPRPDIDLTRQTTDVRFGEVRFKNAKVVFWLPQQVTVNVEWGGRTFRNQHHYSDFKLFTVEAEEKPQAPPP